MRRVPDLAALAARLPARPRTRFAPSPTGWLHLGHVVNAIYTWGVARALGGAVLLRIEDHDRERSRPEYERGDPRRPGVAGPRRGRCEPETSERVSRQSERECSLHAGAGDRSRRAASCTRAPAPAEQIEQIRDRRGAASCATRARAARVDCRWPGRGPARCGSRPGAERFEDALMGAQPQDPSAQTGDLLIRDRLGAVDVSVRRHGR